MSSGFDIGVIVSSLPYLFKTGMVFTLKLTGLAMVIGLALGIILALMRLSSFRLLSVFAAAYVNLIRSIPLLLVIFWCYFLLPYVAAWMIGSNEPVAIGAFVSSVITFALFEAAYYSEIIRAGIGSVPRSQVFASQAIGMTYAQTMSYVVLPQAILRMAPVLLTQTIILFQDVSLVYILSITDFFGAASKIAQRDHRMVEMYVFVALVYFVICFIASRIVKTLQSRLAAYH